MDRIWLPILCAALLLLIAAAILLVGRPELIDAAIAVKSRKREALATQGRRGSMASALPRA
jgi:hypothetical protein